MWNLNFFLLHDQKAIICAKWEQDGPSLESSSYLNVTLRYLGPLDPGTMNPLGTWTLGFLDFRTLGPLPSSTTSYLFLLLHCFGMVWFGKGGWVGEMNYSMVPTLKPWDLLLPSTFSTSNLLPDPSYSSQILHPPPKPPPISSYLLPMGLR